ncbi:hypothetical protein [Micromonospora sp. NBC_00617]|uniref:hypothetical protein n=1 Tax=Micromonospora sp. NBC_00617 TaxID=2903587 RepID=UPI0030DE5EAB
MQLFPARRALLAGAIMAALVLPGATPAQAAATGAVSGRLTTSAGTAAEVLVQVYPTSWRSFPTGQRQHVHGPGRADQLTGST